MVTFYAWLAAQKGKKSPIGDLASDAIRDENFPIEGSLDDVLVHLEANGASDVVIQAFEDAVYEFEQVKKKPKLKERDIERKFVAKAKQLGGKAYKFTSPGCAGVPDRIVVMPGGKILFVELKQDKGVLSQLQIREINRLKSLGCNVHVVYGLDSALSVLEDCHATP